MAQTAEPTFRLSVAQGSATVALTTTAALIAPVVAATSGLSELDLCFIVIAGGATVLSHFNDSGFWLVSRLLEMDETPPENLDRDRNILGHDYLYHSHRAEYDHLSDLSMHS